MTTLQTQRVESRVVERLHPDVLLLDLLMPGLSGLDVLPIVRQRSPHTRVIVVSMYANEAYVVEALRSGAMGYVLKDTGAEELVRAIRHVSQGGRYLSPPLSEGFRVSQNLFASRARDCPITVNFRD